MDENEELIGKISVVYGHDGWQVIRHVGFFACREDAEAYTVEVSKSMTARAFPLRRHSTDVYDRDGRSDDGKFEWHLVSVRHNDHC